MRLTSIMLLSMPRVLIRILISLAFAALLHQGGCETRAECILEEVPMLLDLNSEGEGVWMPGLPTPPTVASANTTTTTPSPGPPPSPNVGTASTAGTVPDTSGTKQLSSDPVTKSSATGGGASPAVADAQAKMEMNDDDNGQHGIPRDEGFKNRVAVVMGGVEVLTFTNYNKIHRFFVQYTKNDRVVFTSALGNHTLSVESAAIFAGHTYKRLQFHFHWGTTSDHGSEHLIDGQRYPMELHLVHLNSEYTDISDALARANGSGNTARGGSPFLVFAVLIDALRPAGDPNPDFDRVAKSLRCVNNSAAGVLHSDPKYGRLNLFNLIPGSDEEFGTVQKVITYNGIRNLTVDGCGGDGTSTTSATWLVFREPLTISMCQIQPFRRLYNAEGNQTLGSGSETESSVEKLGKRRSYLRKVRFESA